MIEAFRRGPYFEQMENGIYVQLTSPEDQLQLMIRAEEIGRQDDTDTVQDDTDTVQDDTDTVEDAWAGVSLY